MSKSKIILVVGATGNQGGAVINALLDTDFKIRALTRNASGATAKKLAERGVDVVEGDLDNTASLISAMQGCHGVYSVQNFLITGIENEIAQGKRVADAAKQTGIGHLVYGSVGGAERQTDVPHFDSKFVVEQYIRDLAIPHTILRPTFFMENFEPKMRVAVLSLVKSCLKNRKLQMIAVADIGNWAAMAFQNQKVFLNKDIEIGGDELSFAEIQQIYVKVLGRKIWSFPVPAILVFSLMKEMGAMFKWLRDHGYKANIDQNRREIPAMLSFEDWLRGQEATLSK